MITADKHKEAKKQTWGPLPTLRRSKRFMDNERTMLEKAQDCKRQYNLEGMQGNNNKASCKTDSATLSSIAHDTGLDLGMAIPFLMLDNMVSLDKARNENFEEICRKKG